MSLCITPMVIDDLEEVIAIERVSFPTPWTRRMFEEEINNPSSYLFILKGCEARTRSVKGYICFWHVLDEAHILNLAVHPDCRRQGTATRLLSFAVAYSAQRHMHKAFLEVRSRNLPAQQLYEKTGFHLVGVRRRYYQDTQDDALLLELDMRAHASYALPESGDGSNA